MVMKRQYTISSYPEQEPPSHMKFSALLKKREANQVLSMNLIINGSIILLPLCKP